MFEYFFIKILFFLIFKVILYPPCVLFAEKNNN